MKGDWRSESAPDQGGGRSDRGTASIHALHEFETPEQFPREAREALRPGGVLLIMDWAKGARTGVREMMVIFIVTLTAGVALSWWRARAGSTILFVCGVAFCVFAYFSAGHHKGFAVLVSGVPVLVCGLLFLASWRWSAKR